MVNFLMLNDVQKVHLIYKTYGRTNKENKETNKRNSLKTKQTKVHFSVGKISNSTSYTRDKQVKQVKDGMLRIAEPRKAVILLCQEGHKPLFHLAKKKKYIGKK